MDLVYLLAEAFKLGLSNTYHAFASGCRRQNHSAAFLSPFFKVTDSVKLSRHPIRFCELNVDFFFRSIIFLFFVDFIFSVCCYVKLSPGKVCDVNALYISGLCSE